MSFPRPAPPPGLGPKLGLTPALVQALQEHWSKFDCSLQETLQANGVACPTESADEPDLKAACKKHLDSLPESIKKLVLSPEDDTAVPKTVIEINRQYKGETANLRDLVSQSVVLQAKIDRAKQTYQDLLTQMQTLTEALNAKQKEVQNLQSQLQAKLQETETPSQEPVPFEPSMFDAFCQALGKAGVQLDEEIRVKIQQNLSATEEPGSKRRKVDEEADKAMQQG